MKKPFKLYSASLQWGNYTRPTEQMIQTLWKCVDIENRYPGRPYGPGDIEGSLIGLYKRGLLDIHVETRQKHVETTWYVTNEGLHFLLNTN